MSKEAPNRLRRKAPRVAGENRAAAKKNIEIKLKLCEFALGLCSSRDATIAFKAKSQFPPEDIFPAIPSSFRAFNDWECKSLPSGLLLAVSDFEKNGHRTLQSHSHLYTSVSAALNLAKARHRLLQKKPSKLESLAGARRRSNDAVVMRDIAIRDSEDARRELEVFQSNSTKKISQLTNELRELKATNTELTTKIALLKKSIGRSGIVREVSSDSFLRKTPGTSL